MKLKQITILLGAAVALSSFTGAMKIKELSLNEGYSNNLQIIQPELVGELSKHYLSDDIRDIYFNVRDLETKHIYDKLPQQYKLSLNAYLHRTSLENTLAGSPVQRNEDAEKVSLLKIIEENYPNTQNIRTNEDYLTVLRSMYTDIFNQYFHVKVLDKKGDSIKASFANHSQYGVKAVRGNLRILDKQDGTVIYDETFQHSFLLTIGTDRMIDFSLKAKIDNPQFKDIPNDRLVYQAQVSEVTLSDKRYLSIQELYDKQTALQVLKSTRATP